MAAELLAIIAPVLLSAAIGFGWVRLGRPYDADLVAALVTGIGTPCLVLSTLSKLHVGGTDFLLVMLATVCVTLVVCTIGAVALRIAGLRRDAYLPALTFPNAGNMGH